MNVLHLINNLHREGAQVVVFNLATAPEDGDVRHRVCAREPGGALQTDLEARGVPVFAPERYYGARETRRSLAFLRRIVREQSIDVIHAHMADAAFLGWRIARELSLPLIITHHGHDLLPRCGRLCRAVYWLLLAAAARYASYNVAVSDVIAQRLRRRLRLPERRLAALANGVPVPPIEQAMREDRLRRNAPVIVSVGRLVELKGHNQLIEAAAGLLRDCPDAQFCLVGDGPLRESLRRQAESLGVAGRVQFAGSVSDVPERLRAADVYVSTSHYEGMPMATLEAMAWGVPVIASDVPGNRAVVRHAQTGLLYPPGDAAALADRLREILHDPDAAAQRALRARRLVERDYSAAVAARRYGELYRAALQRQGRGARVCAERP